MKSTKIICTIGPSSETPKMLASMVQNGMNVARLNFSHGTYENHAMLVKNVRAVSNKLKTPVAIMQDLQGPKIRVSELPAPVPIKAGQKVVIGQDFSMDFDVSSDVKKGHRILIQDGLMQLIVDKVVGKKIYCTVKNGGIIKSHKGMNLPDTRIKARVMTEKDIADLKFGLKQDVDLVALSFVRNAQDIIELKGLIKKYLPKGFEAPKIIAKIELPEALEEFDSILMETDAVMVARGDLGVEIPASKVPVIQKDLITKCLKAAKPVIVATQMLESMIENPRPTRAEVSDVANAVIDRADAVMLSGESAYGKYPLEAVKVMNETVIDVEASSYMNEHCLFEGENEGLKTSAIAASACDLSKGVKADAMVSVTDSGFTARFFSHQRPEPPVFMLTSSPKVYQQMALLWGIFPVLVKRYKNINELLEHAVGEVKKAKLINKGQKVVVVAGHSIGERVNMLAVQKVK